MKYNARQSHLPPLLQELNYLGWLSTLIQLMVRLPNPHFTLCCTVLVFVTCPWELQLKMKAIKEFLGIILLLGWHAYLPEREMMIEV